MEKFNIKALGDNASIVLGNISPVEYASVSHLLKGMYGEYLGNQSSLDEWIQATFSKHGWPYYKGLVFAIKEDDLSVSQIIKVDWYFDLPDIADLVSCSIIYLEDLKDFLTEAINLYDKEIEEMRRYWCSSDRTLLSSYYEINIRTGYTNGLRRYLKIATELIAQKKGDAEI